MNKKKLLVLGASGFIGRNIFEHFSQNKDYDVYGTYCKSEPFTKNKNLLKVDLLNPKEIHDVFQGVDVVFQYAAVTSGAKDIVSSPVDHVTDNAVMNSLLLRAALECNVKRFIFPSCTVMYESSKKSNGEDDFTGNIPQQYFGVGWTKVYIEKMCKFYADISEMKVNVLRQSNIYGPLDKYGSDKSHFFAATIDKVMNKSTNEIEVWGQGKEERDLLHVNDLVMLLENVLNSKEKYTLTNVGLGKSYSVSEVVEKINLISNKNKKIIYNSDKPSLNTKIHIDISKAKNQFDWMPSLEIDEGIQRTLDWYKKNII